MEISPSSSASAADCKYKGSQVKIYADSHGGGSHLCFHDVTDARGAHTYVVQGCMTTQPNGIHWTSDNTCVRVSFNVEIGASWRLWVTSNLKTDNLCQPRTTHPDHDTSQLLADLPHHKLIFAPFTSNKQLPHLHVVPDRGRSNYNATCHGGSCSPYFYLVVISQRHHTYLHLRNNEIRFARLPLSPTPPRKKRNRHHRHRSRRKSSDHHRRRSAGKRKRRKRRGTRSSLHRKMLDSLQALVRSGKPKPTRFKIVTT